MVIDLTTMKKWICLSIEFVEKKLNRVLGNERLLKKSLVLTIKNVNFVVKAPFGWGENRKDGKEIEKNT